MITMLHKDESPSLKTDYGLLNYRIIEKVRFGALFLCLCLLNDLTLAGTERVYIEKVAREVISYSKNSTISLQINKL